MNKKKVFGPSFFISLDKTLKFYKEMKKGVEYIEWIIQKLQC